MRLGKKNWRNMAEYRFSPKSRRDLNDIFDYTVARWGLDQAFRYDMLIEVACSEIAKSPLQAPSCDNIKPGYRRWRIEQHIIYFRQTRYGIAISRILHGRMDATRHF
jgi:toxin ParE1/3/4